MDNRTNHTPKHTFIILAVITFCCSLTSPAQTTDTTLGEVKVRAKHKISHDQRLNDFAPGQKITSIDSATIQQYRLQSMSDLLAQQLPVFIKSYGVNGIATLSFRGSSAAQSQVMWNGVPIQNAALGLADISTIPVLMVSKVNVVYGGSSALWGSGNVGGALLLESDAPVFDSGKRSLYLTGGAGSFGQYTGGISGTVASKKWYLSATAYTQGSNNDFSYTSSSGTENRMTNGHLLAYGAMAQAACKIAEQHTVGVSAWYQQYDRQIPPALFESSSIKQQRNGSLRLLATWNKSAHSNSWYAKSSLIKDEITYSDDAVALYTTALASQYYQELGWKRTLGNNSSLLVFMPIQLLWMNEPITNDLKQQNRIALAAAYSYWHFNNRLNVALNARAEAINTQRIFLPGASASFALSPWLSLRANGQRTYRAPTLNELYYNPGGNAALKPEQGWSTDAGYALKARIRHITLFHDLSVFNRNVRDWIIWLGGAIWTPHNIALVHSRGIETDNKLSFNTGSLRWQLGINTSYVLATTTASYIPGDGSPGRQIPYTPRYNARVNLGLSWKNLSINYIHSYTGYRFITSDESEYLSPYNLGTLQLMYQPMLHRRSIQFTAQCNNLWNQQYAIAGFRPMPGINWLTGIKINIL